MAQLKKMQAQALLLGGILAVLAIVLAYQLLGHPTAQPSGAARPQMARLQADLEQLKRQLLSLPDLERATAARRDTVAQCESRLFQTIAVDTLLTDLSSMATAAHIRIASLEPIAVQGAADGSQGLYEETPIQIRAQGGYHQLGAFIQALEQHQQLLRLVHLEMRGDPAEPWRQSADMIISAFRLLEPAAPPR